MAFATLPEYRAQGAADQLSRLGELAQRLFDSIIGQHDHGECKDAYQQE